MSNSSDKPDKYTPAANPDHSAVSGGAAGQFDLGVQYHKAGRLGEAQAAYHNVLQLEPEHADALHMLGVIAYQKGQYDEALSLITRAGNLMLPNAGVYTNLGNVFQATGRLEEAVAAFRSSIKLASADVIAHNNLGNALRLQGCHDAAVASFKTALMIDNGYAEAHVNLAMTYQAMGDDVRAASSYERAVALDSGNRSAAHMLASLHGEITDVAPPEFVERLFDEYAERFDTHLVTTLGYSMPALLRNEIDRLQGAHTHFHDVIDLGCGTGLAGVAFRSVCDNLKGIDLSARMIGKARDRKVYDSLQVGDVVASLDADEDHYDLLVCADVFPYIGNVQPLFSVVSRHARNGALFAFSTELHPGESFILNPTGRYAHSQEYLRTVAAEHGFMVMTMRTENLRKHEDQWTRGDLVVLRYQG